jgi:hypothetical protein
VKEHPKSGAGDQSRQKVCEKNLFSIIQLLLDGQLLCPSVTAYYEGTFHNDWQPSIDQKVQFQARLAINETLNQMIAKIDHWNEALMPSGRTFLHGYHSPYYCKLGEACSYLINT